MKKIICDVCGEEVLESSYQAIAAYSQKSRIDGAGYGESHYFLKLELHPGCAEAIEHLVKEAVEKYIDEFPRGKG